MKLLVFCLCLSLSHAAVIVNPFGDEGACGEDQPRYINQSVIFSSPNFGSEQVYPPNQDCTWLIDYTGDNEETSVKIEFQDFTLEECTDCTCDFVEAYDGDSTSDPSLGRRCGNSATELVSEGQQMLVRFVSDDSTEFKGFRASNIFDILPPAYCTSGGLPLELTDPTGFVSSPGFGETFYPASLQCKWQISTPGATGYRLEFDESFGTEDCCRCDYLELHTGTSNRVSELKRGQWYGTHTPHVFEIVGGDLFAYFASDSSGSDVGFGFTYTAMF